MRITKPIAAAVFTLVTGLASPAFADLVVDNASGKLTLAADAYLQYDAANLVLNFDANDYFFYSRGTNTYAWVIGSATKMSLDSAAVLTIAGPIIATLEAGAGAGAVCSSAASGGTFTYSAGATCTVSSRRYKHDIRDSAIDSDVLYKLRPVDFTLNSDKSGRRAFGLIAEEVAEVFPTAVVRLPDGTVESLYYDRITTLAVMALQKLQLRVAELESRLAELESR